ncbi:hypothetical protein EAF04_000769 [Stromatinia cepivora]|nr:hypothetical protein EAF04_000769 [Stromatinia cepivora]
MTGNVIPSAGNSRLDAKLPGGHRIIREDMTCAEFHDSVWGFVIYRCVEGNDAAWNSILEQLQSHIQENPEDGQCQDLFPFHDLHVIDDKSLYGASIDEVRAYFQAWVPKNTPSVRFPTRDMSGVSGTSGRSGACGQAGLPRLGVPLES